MKSDDDKAPKKQQQQKLSLQQLQDVRDCLKQPLTDRSVLIPCGTKAFFAGRLTPSVTITAAAEARLTDDGAAADGKPAVATATKNLASETTAVAAALREYVVVRMSDGTEKEMTRQDALDYLQKEIEERKEETKKAKVASAIKQNVPPPKKKSAISSRSKKQAVPRDDDEPNNTVLPFIEIREELDESGHAVRCETIDVSEQLKNLKSKGEQEISSSFGSSVVQEDENEMEEDAAATNTPTNSAIDPNDNMPKPLSDSEYDALAARLEELARLEEHAETNKSVNLKSSKKLQSKGWSKGFLNNKSSIKKPKKTQAPPKTASETTTSAENLTPASENNATTAARQSASQKPPQDDAPSSKTVAFGDTEIREIPRVGERSVRATLPRPPPSRPLDDAIFPGVVQEKKAAAQNLSLADDQPKKVSRFAQERASSGSSNSSAQQPAPQAKKRVSRFAQERQQGLR